MLDGRLLDGADGNAGHIGHLVVEPDGRPCRVREPRLPRGRGVRSRHRGDHRAAPGRRAARGAASGRAGSSVARWPTSASLLDLGLAVVAGSVALGFGDVFFTAAQAELDRRARISFARGARIVPAGLGADGPLIGAAAVARRTVVGAGRDPHADRPVPPAGG